MAIHHSLQWETDRIPRNRKITHGPGPNRFAVDGIEPGAEAFPNTSKEVGHLLPAQGQPGERCFPFPRRRIGRPVDRPDSPACLRPQLSG